jgi:hypothetical protein
VVLLKPIQKQVGELSVNGDYGAPRKGVSQVDGCYKLLAFEAEKQIKHRILYEIPELAEGQYIHILASGKNIKIAYSADWADLNAQLTAIATAINGVKWKNRSNNSEDALFQAEVADVENNKYLKVESTEQKRNVEFKIALTNKATINWKLIRGTETFGGINIFE